MKLFWQRWRRLILGTIAAFGIYGVSCFLPPANFPIDRVITIMPGQDFDSIATMLADQHVVRSAWLFTALVSLERHDRHLVATYYQFETPLSLFSIVNRLLTGKSTIHPVTLRFPEGLSNEQLARIITSSDLAEFDARQFLTVAHDLQGYLFPSTYLVPSHISTNQLIGLFYDTFNEQFAPLKASLEHSGRTLAQVIGMAAILEREAATSDDRRMVADILWRRYDQGVRLQVDVASTTYKTAGLPDRPIDNPGLDAMKAVLDPLPNSYWYYLSDSHSKMHYARTYAEHQKNVARYLK